MIHLCHKIEKKYIIVGRFFLPLMESDWPTSVTRRTLNDMNYDETLNLYLSTTPGVH